MIRRISALILILMLVGNAHAEDEPLLTYHWHGGYSPYKEIRVTISKAGAVLVTGQKQGLPPIDYRTELSPEELGTLKTLVQSTEFFSQPERDTDFAIDVGETELTIHLKGQSKSLIYHSRPSLEPLENLIWKLITQASAIQAIECGGDIYSAIGAVIPTHAGMKALQPGRLKVPLMLYVRGHDNKQKVQWALEALAWITTPEEFSGFISLGLEEETQRKTLLSIIGTHPFYGNIPESHLRSLCPGYLRFVRDAHPRVGEISEIEKKALSDFTSLLGFTRYEPSIPMLKEWFEHHDQPYITTSLTPLAKMGAASLGALTPYLESPEEPHRINAIELLTIASRLGPHGGFANPLSDYEYMRMVPVFTNTVIPRLRALSVNDPSDKVKRKARDALEEIRKQIEKEEIPTNN